MVTKGLRLCAIVALFFALFLPNVEAGRRGGNELSNLTLSTVEVDGVEVQRLELELSQSDVPCTIRHAEGSRQIFVRFPKTKTKNLEAVQNLDEGYVHAIAFLQTAQDEITMKVVLAQPIEDKDFKIYVAKPDNRLRKPRRLVLDIYPHDAMAGAGRKLEHLSEATIVIDPGHGGSDSGAVGPSGLQEKDVALTVGLELRDLLTRAGAHVIMTRDTDVDVHSRHASATQELGARARIANEAGADLFLSIHCNAFIGTAPHGMETYYYHGSPQGKKLATLLNEELEEAGGRFNRGVKGAPFYVLKHTQMPASLVELAFISNPEEEELLGDSVYQMQLAQALARGLDRYFKE